jgi:glycosyltransferase involved in cell wall biosynthesis
MSIPISVVVCTRNRVDSLRRCIQTLAASHTDREWELVIVDNGSDDGTNAFLASLPSDFGKAQVIIAFEPKPGLAAARNRGLGQTRGDIVAFTDDDCYASEDYIDAMISAFENPEVGFVGGRILLYDQSDIKITTRESEDYLILNPRTFVATGIVQGANMAFRRAVLDHIGGFDENLGAGTRFPCEDIDAVAALVWEGVSGAYDPRPMIFHHHGRKTKREERDLRKTYDEGRGAYYVKYILRSDSREKYIRGWVSSIKHGAFSGSLKSRSWHLRKLFRELCGGLLYIAMRASHKCKRMLAR